MFQLLLLPVIMLVVEGYNPAFQHVGKPDLIILDVEFSFQEPVKSAPNDPRIVPRAGFSPVMGELAITVGNIGTAELSESFEVSWEVEGSGYYLSSKSGNTRVNSERSALPVGGFLVVHVCSYDFTPGAFVNLHLQKQGNWSSNDVRLEELDYDNNSLQFNIPKR